MCWSSYKNKLNYFFKIIYYYNSIILKIICVYKYIKNIIINKLIIIIFWERHF